MTTQNTTSVHKNYMQGKYDPTSGLQGTELYKSALEALDRLKADILAEFEVSGPRAELAFQMAHNESMGHPIEIYNSFKKFVPLLQPLPVIVFVQSGGLADIQYVPQNVEPDLYLRTYAKEAFDLDMENESEEYLDEMERMGERGFISSPDGLNDVYLREI